MDAARPAPAAEDQLRVIEELGRVLDRAGIEHWLFGGWAVDFWVGEVTRPHGDIDVAAWRRDFDVIRSALVSAGWEHTPAPDDLVGTRYRRGEVEVELTFVEPADDGRGVTVPLPTGPVTWSAEPLGDDRVTLRGVTCRVIPLPLLTAGKSRPREGAAEAAKDRADLAALSRLGDHERPDQRG